MNRNLNCVAFALLGLPAVTDAPAASEKLERTYALPVPKPPWSIVEVA